MLLSVSTAESSVTRLSKSAPLRAEADARLRRRAASGVPRPGVAKPQVRQEVQRRGLRAAIERLDADADVFRRRPWRTR